MRITVPTSQQTVRNIIIISADRSRTYCYKLEGFHRRYFLVVPSISLHQEYKTVSTIVIIIIQIIMTIMHKK